MVATLLAAITGCSSHDSNLAPVHGKVTIDGQPMTWGRIQFAPVATGDNKFPGKAAFGWIQQDGTFTLTTYDNDDGAIVGEHRVAIYRRKPVSETSADPNADHVSSTANAELKFDTLRLVSKTFQVQAGTTNDIPVELTSEFVKKYGDFGQ